MIALSPFQPILRTNSVPAAPLLLSPGHLIFTTPETGEVYELASDGASVVLQTGGIASCVAADRNGGFFVGDLGHGALLAAAPEGDISALVREYEGSRLLGPTGIVLAEDGSLFFTDGGPLGQSGLFNPTGSLFQISSDGQVLHPVALRCLAGPQALVQAPDGSIFVAEMMANRILRFSMQSNGILHASVFYQFAGGVGPSSLAVGPEGTLFVGLFDFAGRGNEKRGRVVVISEDGKCVSSAYVPAPEVNGVAYDRFVRCATKLYFGAQNFKCLCSPPN